MSDFMIIQEIILQELNLTERFSSDYRQNKATALNAKHAKDQHFSVILPHETH